MWAVFGVFVVGLVTGAVGCSGDSTEAKKGGGGTGSMSAAGGSSSTEKSKAFAECCAGDGECASGVCSPKHLACSIACTKDEDCPAEPKSGKPSCSMSAGVCEAERADVTCEPHSGSGGQSGGGASGSGASAADGGSSASGGGGASSGGSGAGASSGAPHLVQCTTLAPKQDFDNLTTSDICRCTADDNTGMTSYRGEQACGQGDGDLFCCGDSGYPDTGSCTCYQKRTWQCLEGGSGANAFCECWYYGDIGSAVNQVPTTSCDLDTKSYAARCYVFDVAGGQRCQCDARPLPSGARTVPGCSTAKDADVTVLTGCPADKTTADTCSKNLYVPPPGSTGCGASCSGTMCVGDSLCCTYSCAGDTCAQHCNF